MNEAKPESAGNIPTPSPEIRRLLKVLKGQWSTAVTYEPSELMPEGGTTEGREKAWSGPGGLSIVIEEASLDESAGGFEARGMIVWSQPEKAYKLYWFTNNSPVPGIFTGTWEGADIVFNGTEQMMGQEFASRHTITNIQPNAFHYLIDMGARPDLLKRAVTIDYTRIGPNTP